MTRYNTIAHLSGGLINLMMVPQLVVTMSTQDVAGLSTWTFVIYIIALGGWIYYSHGTRNRPMLIQNSISLALAMSMLLLILIFRRG